MRMQWISIQFLSVNNKNIIIQKNKTVFKCDLNLVNVILFMSIQLTN